MNKNLKELINELKEKLDSITIDPDLLEDSVDASMNEKGQSLHVLKTLLSDTLETTKEISNSRGQQDISKIEHKIFAFKFFGSVAGFIVWLIIAPYLYNSFSIIKAKLFSTTSDSVYAHPMARINGLTLEELAQRDDFIAKAQQVDVLSKDMIIPTLLFIYGFILLSVLFSDMLELSYRKQNGLTIEPYFDSLKNRKQPIIYMTMIFIIFALTKYR